jgi:2-oxoglutarate dehydrogenase E2 component (dihydrolipoamide succinyltransferase)
MSFFVKAAVEALKQFPAVNAEIDGDAHRLQAALRLRRRRQRAPRAWWCRCCATPTALVRRGREGIGELAQGQGQQAALSRLHGGTFTISNGGVYGSMMSTPILNPPQVASWGCTTSSSARRR